MVWQRKPYGPESSKVESEKESLMVLLPGLVQFELKLSKKKLQLTIILQIIILFVLFPFSLYIRPMNQNPRPYYQAATHDLVKINDLF